MDLNISDNEEYYRNKAYWDEYYRYYGYKDSYAQGYHAEYYGQDQQYDDRYMPKVYRKFYP